MGLKTGLGRLACQGRAGLAIGLTALAIAGAPAQAASSCKLAKVAAIPLEQDGNNLLARVIINGKPAHMIVDTGAWGSLLSRSSLGYLGLTAVDAHTEVVGIDGTSRMLQTTMDSIELGAWRSRDVRVYVGGYGEWRGDTVGLLGMDLLERYDMEFDVAHNLLSLYKPENCDNDVLAYWSDTYNVTDMDSVRGNRSRIRVPVLVNGQTVHAELDSGASITVLDEGVARRVGIDVIAGDAAKAGNLQGANGYSVETHIGTFDSFSIGDETIRHAKLRVTDLYNRVGTTYVGSRLSTSYGDTDMYLGADFLRSHRVYIASSQRKVYFTYQGGPVFQVVGPALTAASRGAKADEETEPSAAAPTKAQGQ
ncbi:retropepsin-like aspartic protease family protein [Nitrospirillum viridazoti]|uniref:Clan AA aspartic protease (TIGR02281 family) n=1 Tax=Nitrospirillum amazonense TaxID=28077 RepID=A0A560HZD4_9PROT|nr:retropepsin-like aspartic protease [Nitrospirillum amazonense]TWB50949.1 clan AA aspartic protease (TIGR02281 family) [Nitrospirillum amazonense]